MMHGTINIKYKHLLSLCPWQLEMHHIITLVSEEMCLQLEILIYSKLIRWSKLKIVIRRERLIQQTEKICCFSRRNKSLFLFRVMKPYRLVRGNRPSGEIHTAFLLSRSRYSDCLRAGRSGDRIPVGSRFSAPVQTGPGAHPASCTMGTGSFPEVKSGRGVNLTPHPLLVP